MIKYLTIEDKQSDVKVQIQNQRIKMYITKEMGMVNNIDSIYENIWGRCTEPLHNMVKHLDEFNLEHKERDVIFSLKNIKTVSTTIDSLVNKHVNYFNALKYCFNTRQGTLEGYKSYIKQAR